MPDFVQPLNCNPTTTDAPASFLCLPSELRNTIYELILLRSEPIDPWAWYDLQELTTGLLRASKAVHGEASSLFYSQNRFDFTGVDPEKLAWFLEQIGSHNAGCIRHIVIDFPEFLYPDPGDITIDESSVSILASIQSGCANLSTLTTSLYSTNAMELQLDNLDDYNAATEVLTLVDTRFRAISSLQEIILEVYEDGPSDHLRRRMESYGWTLSTTVYVEEED
ncbi:hypothetical protein EDB80DRAFT_721339 [Ilyonectria destructans]|nr:hypothetical protein EDB80DRAFT_721339 [Ilyonectria destructans]